jgi:hypothetical protein
MKERECECTLFVDYPNLDAPTMIKRMNKTTINANPRPRP